MNGSIGKRLGGDQITCLKANSARGQRLLSVLIAPGNESRRLQRRRRILVGCDIAADDVEHGQSRGEHLHHLLDIGGVDQLTADIAGSTCTLLGPQPPLRLHAFGPLGDQHASLIPHSGRPLVARISRVLPQNGDDVLPLDDLETPSGCFFDQELERLEERVGVASAMLRERVGQSVGPIEYARTFGRRMSKLGDDLVSLRRDGARSRGIRRNGSSHLEHRARRAAAGFADDRFGRENDLGGTLAVFELGEQQLGRLAAQLIERLANGGERGTGELRHVGIVESDHRDPPGNANSP